MNTLKRRKTLAATPAVLTGAAALSTSAPTWATEGYAPSPERISRYGPLQGLSGAALRHELVSYATLAPSSQNTRCWMFAAEDQGITILSYLSRRCPRVDPDDPHLYASLGYAAENLVQAAQAIGLHGQVHFDSARNAVMVALTPAPAIASLWFKAITERQCTRGLYDGMPLNTQDLVLLEGPGSPDCVRLLIITAKGVMNKVLDHLMQGNSQLLNVKTFVTELKAWIRFNAADAVERGVGLFGKSSGNPSLPTWLGYIAFGLVVIATSENEKYTTQLRSSSCMAVLA